MPTSLAVVWTMTSVGSPVLAAAEDLPPSEAAPAPPPSPAAASSAETPPPASPGAAGAGLDRMFVLALRPVGAGLAVGSVAEDSSLSDLTVAIIPVWLDVGYMVTPDVMLGIYGQVALASGGHEWTGSGSDIRFGAQAQYHVSPAGTIDPWLGLGMGHEILSTTAATGVDATATVQGIEFANLQAGLDVKLGSAFGLGPVVSFSLGQYSSASSSDPITGGHQAASTNRLCTSGRRWARTPCSISDTGNPFPEAPSAPLVKKRPLEKPAIRRR
jgi:hypothetical protein